MNKEKNRLQLVIDWFAYKWCGKNKGRNIVVENIKTSNVKTAEVFMTFAKAGIYSLLPENLNIDQHFSVYPPDRYGFESNLEFQKDKVLYILGLLLSIPARNKSIISDNGFVPFSAKLLNNNITDYRAYISYLCDTCVIEVYNEGAYVVGESSKRYRWCEQYRNSKLIKVYTDCGVREFNKKKKTVTVEEFKRSLLSSHESLATYPYLSYWYNTDKLRVDYDAACEYAYFVRKNLLDKGKEHWEDNKDKGCKKNPYTQCYAIIWNLDKLKEQNYEAQINDNVHRLYSVLTNMQKVYRKFLSYDSQELVSIDIKNSQPYISCLLLNKDFWATNSPLPLSFNKLPRNIIDSIRVRNKKDDSYPIVEDINDFFNNLDTTDIETFKEIVASGKMYETIKEWTLNEEGVTIDRDKAKVTIFLLFFSSNYVNSSDENHWLRMLFNSKFPNVAELFKIIKRKFRHLDEEKQHGRLACLLQTIESEIILHRCCKRIWEEGNQQIPVFTIHDSIVTTRDNVEFVINIMTEELTSCIGLAPSLEVEVWNSSALQEEVANYNLNLT
jgi:hypothetical protein